ncbi:hypothetical protein [Janthinobacterium sp.]|uniref:hypothetical protein n=1 Tax=Janthinobacterium sp. TaxID=1871054 RepID=UPI00260C396E|nr:hypothetical protein [Janthinobacterium sp.]
MMNAIVPLNIAALRVNNNDATNVVSGLQGKTAKFSAMPWCDPSLDVEPSAASTGDKIYAPLASVNGHPLSSPGDPLGVGVHLHWTLPDYFNKGVQDCDGGNPVFPAAPNRWLVTRFLSFLDTNTGKYGSISSKSWVVESDYLADSRAPDSYGIVRPAISVPIPSAPGFQQQPFMYMGRVVDAHDWDPRRAAAGDYLPSYKGTDGRALYLTAIGFVGAYFGAYYPECSSVFGFWDHFSDVPCDGHASLRAALQVNAALQFRVSYQVTGWLNEAQADPLIDIDELVKTQYESYLAQCAENQVDPEQNPNDFFRHITADKMKWSFCMSDVHCQLNADLTIAALDYPQRTLVAGTAQEIVWNMTADPGTTYFLKSNTPASPAVWSAEVDIAVGNSTEEAVAALLKPDMGQGDGDGAALDCSEYLLNALQLGILSELGNMSDKLIALEEALHDNAFSHLASGYLWIVGSREVGTAAPVNPDAQVTLPLNLAEHLYLLNQAQKEYDMGRAALLGMRRQLFMDWTHYIKLYTGEPLAGASDAYITADEMGAFINSSDGGELHAVIEQGRKVGMLSYVTDPLAGAVTGIHPPVAGVARDSLAYTVWECYNRVVQVLEDYADWQLQCTSADNFFLPNEPVILMQGDMLDPVDRNGKQALTFVRLSQEILGQLDIRHGAASLVLSVGDVPDVPGVNPDVPMRADVQALMGEAFLITPMLAATLAGAVASLGGQDNPALRSPDDFTAAMMSAQGGLSPLDLAPHPGGMPAPGNTSLFDLVNDDDYQAGPNPVIAVAAPQALSIGFGNAGNNGWAPGASAWTTQTTPGGFSPSHVNPFLPVFMLWNIRLSPLACKGQADKQNPSYSQENISDFFQLDGDAIDHVYRMNGSQAINFTSPLGASYGSSAIINANSADVLVYQIGSYISDYSVDPDHQDGSLQQMQSIADQYANKKFIAQSISGFNNEQILNTFVAQLPLQNLTKGPRDSITKAVASAAVQNDWDNWYRFGFNSVQPISTGLLAQNNFGPLRAGFLEVLSVEIVDAFGQRMDLSTARRQPSGALDVTTAISLTPAEDDLANRGKIYLPPRVLAPTRLWLQWLSASHDNTVPGISRDFEEMSRHPATSPVCGWIMPNHLDNNLFFYDELGKPIGTLGIEHIQTDPAVVYRTRAGNLGNPENRLALDIGAAGAPTVNAHLANYMWYLQGQSAYYLQDLMTSIVASTNSIGPDSSTQNSALSVLIGRPLALVRAVAGLETAGNLLPLSQANHSPGSALPQDVNNRRVDYRQRMQHSSANLQNVRFPLRMGDLANFDDGLIGYLIESSGDNPYLGQPFYAPAAGSGMQHGVQKPAETTLQLTLNGAPHYLTMLVDPHGAVHATTGILPVHELRIPVEQYVTAMQNLAVNFVTRPVLKMAHTFIVPLPVESGYGWSWITPGAADATALLPALANETPMYGYSPQTLQEGWLELTPEGGA